MLVRLKHRFFDYLRRRFGRLLRAPFFDPGVKRVQSPDPVFNEFNRFFLGHIAAPGPDRAVDSVSARNVSSQAGRGQAGGPVFAAPQARDEAGRSSKLVKSPAVHGGSRPSRLLSPLRPSASGQRRKRLVFTPPPDAPGRPSPWGSTARRAGNRAAAADRGWSRATTVGFRGPRRAPSCRPRNRFRCIQNS